MGQRDKLIKELKKKNKIWRERLAMQSKSLVELVRSGELRPPQEISACQFCLTQEISACQFCLRHYKNEQEDER